MPLPNLIIRLGGGLGARIKTNGDNEFVFESAPQMQVFIECVEALGWFPCEDWFLKSVVVIKEEGALTDNQRKEDTVIIDVNKVLDELNVYVSELPIRAHERRMLWEQMANGADHGTIKRDTPSEFSWRIGSDSTHHYKLEN